jgi:hypothetical protein
MYVVVASISGETMMQRTAVALSAMLLIGVVILGGCGVSKGNVQTSLVPGMRGSMLYVDGVGPGRGIPYEIPGNPSVDRCPLTEPYGPMEQPPLQITIKGGVGITVTVKNLGTWDAIQVDWLSTLLGGYFVSSSLRYQSGTIPMLTPGQELVVMKTHHLFGIGLMNIIVNVGKATAFQRGFLLGFFYIPFPQT